MADAKQPVEGGKILDAIKRLLFKGLEGLLNGTSSDTEYVEEDGVVKQISNIVLKSKKTGKDFNLKIKLAPIKDKDGLYYVEAESEDPNFDVSSIDRKTMRLNQDTKEDFDKLIDDLIEKNNSEKVPTEELLQKEIDESEEDEIEPEEDEGLTLQEKEQIKELEEEVEKTIGKTEFPVKINGEKSGIVHVEFLEDGKLKIFSIRLSVIDYSGNSLEYPVEKYTLETVDKNGYVKKYTDLSNEVKETVRKYAQENSLELVQATIGSTIIDAKFVRASNNTDVELIAINASCNIKAAMNTVEEIIQSDEFDNMIGEDPVSIRITDDGEEISLEEIDEVDTSNTYDQMFQDATNICNVLNIYRWAFGYKDWCGCAFLESCYCVIDNAVDQIANWIVLHTDHYPIPSANIIVDNNLSELKDSSGKLSVDAACIEVKRMLETFLECLDCYYVNLPHDEQSLVNDWMLTIKNNIAHV